MRILILLSNFLLKNVLFEIIRAMSYNSSMAIQELRQRRGDRGSYGHLGGCWQVHRVAQISDPLHSSVVTWRAEISGALLHYVALN